MLHAAPLEPLPTRRIITGMRSLLLALMIVLLPLRGWMGDAMAMNAATGTQVAIQSIADSDPVALGTPYFDAESADSALAGTPAECPDHTPGANVASGPAMYRAGSLVESVHMAKIWLGAVIDGASNASSTSARRNFG